MGTDRVATNPGKTVCVSFADGCPRAKVDTAQLFDYFLANGWRTTEDLEHADVVVVTGCGFNERSETASLRLIHSASDRKAADSRLIITGCLAGIQEEMLRREFKADVVPPVSIDRLDRILEAEVPIASVPDPHQVLQRIDEASACYSDSLRKGRLRSFLANSGLQHVLLRLAGLPDSTGERESRPPTLIRVARGCLGECTYCAIRKACGPLRSKPLIQVLSEFDEALGAGDTDFVLVAQDLGAYGQDIGSNVAQLLESLFARPGTFSLSLVDLDVRWFIEYADQLIPLLASNAARIKDVRMPLQSGSDSVLKRMQRGHTARDALRVLTAFRQAAPSMVLETHIMVGFPGETEDEFRETVDFLEAVRFDRVSVYGYTDRPGVPSSRMPDKIPLGTRILREWRVRRQVGAVQRKAAQESI